MSIVIVRLFTVSLMTAFVCGFKPGWGFASHGGFPPLPNAWQGMSLRDATVGYFLGNASGPDSSSELVDETKLGIVGIGWQLDNIPSNHSHLEYFELSTARKLKQTRSSVKVMVLRNTQVVTAFWDAARKVMYDPSTQDYWLQCGGKPCEAPWVSPAGNTPKYFLNFSNPRCADWWVNDYVGAAVQQESFDGVYFDCSCGESPGDDLNQTRLMLDAQHAFDRALNLIVNAGKWASAWNSDDRFYNDASCGQSVRSWLQQQNQRHLMNKLQSNTSAVKHTWQLLGPAFVNGSDAAINNTIAAFLISRPNNATLQLPVLGAYESASDFTLPQNILNLDWGEPLSLGVEIRQGIFHRNFSNINVQLNCNNLSSKFIVLPQRNTQRRKLN